MGLSAPWQMLKILDRQFRANLTALASRDPALAEQIEKLDPPEYLLRTEGDKILIAIRSPDGAISTLPNPVPAGTAMEVTRKLFPSGKCSEPVGVVGLDQGWLWRSLFELEISTPHAPGHRPPLYFFCREVERIWAVLHLHDFRRLLTSPRVQLHCGTNAIAAFAQVARDHPELPFPKLTVTVDPALWSAGVTINSVLQDVVSAQSSRFEFLKQQLADAYLGFDLRGLRQRIQDGSPLRILGITSRYTTFLQYSMRDWLDSMEALGHKTRLAMEDADYHLFNPIATAEACERFKPDLILAIDHFRGEITGLPAAVPCVMWVQDHLPNIFSAKAGAAQGPVDYAIGQGRVECVHQLGYPPTRFMPAMIGTNENRFTCSQPTSEELAAYGCDVSFVSHCSIPAEVIIKEEIDRLNSPASRRLLQGIFDQLRAIYDSGQAITQQAHIEAIIRQTLLDTETSVPDTRPLFDLFTHRINNALFRHQTIGWIAEMPVDLRLYGRGWERNPRFARFARGIADNQNQLAAIHRASRINLQVTPFGAAHQRMFDGLACGGFFLIRGVQGDQFDRRLRDLWKRCQQLRIENDADLVNTTDAEVRRLLDQLGELDGGKILGRGYDFVSELKVNADEGFTRSAGTLWEEFDQVAFHNQKELQQRMTQFLTNPNERERLTASMRKRVVQCMTYRAVSRRMLRFIADDLGRRPVAVAA